jgi:regulator of replication initiation timing
MAKTAAAARTTDLDPIDRLEDKVKRLVEMIAQLRAEQARTAGDNARLTQELDALRAQLADAEATGSELTALRDERDLIRSRVAEMLEQLEAI